MTQAARRSDSDYAAAWSKVLPEGSAWPREVGTTLQNFLLGMSGIWGQQQVNFPSISVDGRAADMVETESDPRFTIEMLPDWEAAFGLPDTCLAEPLTIGDRHRSLTARYTMLGAQDPGFMVGIAASIGYAIQILEHSPFMCAISQVGDTRPLSGPTFNYRWELGDAPIRQSWMVIVLNPRLSWFQCGEGQCGVDPMLTIGVFTDLECLLTRIKPAHTSIFFNFSGVTVNGQFAGIHYPNLTDLTIALDLGFPPFGFAPSGPPQAPALPQAPASPGFVPTPFNVGYSSVGGSNGTYAAGVTNLGGGYAMPQKGALQSISIYSRVATGHTAILGVYDNTGPGGSPGNLLAQTASFSPGAAGFEAHPTLTNPIILSGAIIYIAVLPITTLVSGKFDSIGPQKFYFDSGGDVALPSTYSNTGGGSPFSNTAISIYASFNTTP